MAQGLSVTDCQLHFMLGCVSKSHVSAAFQESGEELAGFWPLHRTNTVTEIEMKTLD